MIRNLCFRKRVKMTPDIDTNVRRKKGRFPKYVFLALFLPIAALVVVIGISFASLRTDARINEILEHDITRLNLISGFIGAEVLGSLKHLRSLSTEAVTREALTSRGSDRQQSLESSFLVLARRNPQYQQVRWIDESGVERARISRDQGEPVVVAPQDLQDKSSRYYFEKANKLLLGELYISPIDLNMEHGKIETPPRPVLRIATPVEDSNRKRRGIIVINIEMKHLFNLVRTPMRAGVEVAYLLVDQQGMLLNDESGNFQVVDEQQQGLSFARVHPKIWEQVSMHDSGSLETQDGLWTWKKLSPVDTFNRLSRVFPEHLVAFDQLISDDFSLTLVAHRPPAALVEVRRENRMLISLIIVSGLSVYGLSLFFYLSGHARARRAELEAAHAMARATHLTRMKELEERFHRVVEASNIGQLVVDGDGIIEISNPAADRMLGYESGGLEGLSVDALLPPDLQEKHAQLRGQYMQAPEARQMGVGRELKARRKDGSLLAVEIGLTPYLDHGRQLVLASIIDLSQRNG